MNSDQVLDDEIVVEEIEGAIKRIKRGKRAGRDNICAEHLLYGGELLKVWLKQVFNTIISFEEIPNCLKTSLIKPIYKGRGKDPLETSSFRGVALSSTIAKLLEYIILERMKPILLEFNSPHFLQTAYQRGVSCGDAIFATQEAALKVLREGGKAFLSLFDLEKAFDTIEKAVLLQCLYNKGISGRAWRIINSWYTGATAAIEIENTVSELFQQERGVRQGSVLSPTLFLMVMDEMLKK